MAGINRFKKIELPYPCTVGVISDTHYTSLPSEAEADLLLYFEGLTTILHMGDVTHPSLLNDIELLGFRVIAVQGNNDRMLLNPHVIELTSGPYTIGMIHGSGGGYNYVEGRALRIIRSLTNTPLDAVLYGHTHVPRYYTNEAGVRFLNPGSLCHPRSDPTGTYPARPSLATLEFSPEGLIFHTFQTDL